MVASNQLMPGMTVVINGKIYKVESCTKVTQAPGNPFIKTKLRSLETGNVTEKNFKLNQEIEDVVLEERRLEFLYPDRDKYLFLDIGNLEQVRVPSSIIGSKVNYLKEGVDVKALLYGQTVFSLELPEFLELMVVSTRAPKAGEAQAGAKIAQLEPGAEIEVPPFIEIGDIIKVSTQLEEYIQRV